MCFVDIYIQNNTKKGLLHIKHKQSFLSNIYHKYFKQYDDKDFYGRLVNAMTVNLKYITFFDS